MIKTLLIRNSLNNLLPQFDDKPNNLTNGIEYIPKPIGLLYIKTFFEQEGLVCDILDLDVIKPSDRLKICLDTAYNYDYIGFSTMTCAFNDTCRIASEIKKKNPNIKIVFGGAHATYAYEDTINKPFIDFVIRGEGEYALKDLVTGAPPGQIKGLVYLSGSKIKNNGMATIGDLDKLPIVMREIERKDYNYNKAEPIYTSRGCVGNCNFCVESRMFKIRYRSIESIFKELNYLYSIGVRDIYFADSNLFNNKAFSKKIFSLLTENHWNFNIVNLHMSVETGSLEFVDLMLKSGIRAIEIGVESLNPESLYYINKTNNPVRYIEKAKKLLKGLYLAGFDLDINFLAPLKGQNINNVKEEIEYLSQFGTVLFYILTPYPGTPLYDKYKDSFNIQNFDFFDSQHIIINHSEITEPAFNELWMYTKLNEQEEIDWLNRYH